MESAEERVFALRTDPHAVRDVLPTLHRQFAHGVARKCKLSVSKELHYHFLCNLLVPETKETMLHRILVNLLFRERLN